MFIDKRGYFREIMRGNIAQINESFSKKGVVRGLHYQQPAVTKWVWVSKGMILDVRMNLETGDIDQQILSADNKRIFEIPKGYAHGFQALENSIVCYAMDGEYNPEGDNAIYPLEIEWPLKVSEVSNKDKEAPRWQQR